MLLVGADVAQLDVQTQMIDPQLPDDIHIGMAPAERRHHERKLELLQKKIEQRQASNNGENNEALTDQDNDLEES